MPHELTGEWAIRAGAFAAVFMLLALCETVWPKRDAQRVPHLWTNLGLMAANTVLLRLLGLGTLAFVAAFAETRGIGLLNWLQLPSESPALAGALTIASAIAAVVLLDLSMYAQHRVFHGLPLLWRVHSVHHADQVFDVSTGVRFHPGEALASFAMKAAAVVAIGAPLAAVLAFEVLLSTASLFSHANLRIAAWVEPLLRRVLVTPDMHRIHHSEVRDEQNRNFGFFLSVWDRVFATYRAAPAAAHTQMRLGLDSVPAEMHLGAALIAPWRRDLGSP